tara:strand:- start:612 stop:803 length:192 start_codon:yes stop_codon:yes gene_type:complete
MNNATKERTNTQISVSFGQDEKELLTLLDEGRKKEHISRSAWFKNQIRKQYGIQPELSHYTIY